MQPRRKWKGSGSLWGCLCTCAAPKMGNCQEEEQDGQAIANQVLAEPSNQSNPDAPEVKQGSSSRQQSLASSEQEGRAPQELDSGALSLVDSKSVILQDERCSGNGMSIAHLMTQTLADSKSASAFSRLNTAMRELMDDDEAVEAATELENLDSMGHGSRAPGAQTTNSFTIAPLALPVHPFLTALCSPTTPSMGHCDDSEQEEVGLPKVQYTAGVVHLDLAHQQARADGLLCQDLRASVPHVCSNAKQPVTLRRSLSTSASDLGSVCGSERLPELPLNTVRQGVMYHDQQYPARAGPMSSCPAAQGAADNSMAHAAAAAAARFRVLSADTNVGSDYSENGSAHGMDVRGGILLTARSERAASSTSKKQVRWGDKSDAVGHGDERALVVCASQDLDMAHHASVLSPRQLPADLGNALTVIGRGAHGTVYKGMWQGTDVAVKVVAVGNPAEMDEQEPPLDMTRFHSQQVDDSVSQSRPDVGTGQGRPDLGTGQGRPDLGMGQGRSELGMGQSPRYPSTTLAAPADFLLNPSGDAPYMVDVSLREFLTPAHSRQNSHHALPACDSLCSVARVGTSCVKCDLETEAEIAMALQHPNIVATYACYTVNHGRSGRLAARARARQNSVGMPVTVPEHSTGTMRSNSGLVRNRPLLSAPPLTPRAQQMRSCPSSGCPSPVGSAMPTTGTMCYMIMELCDAGNLQKLASKQGPNGLPPSMALPLFVEVAAALAYMHSQNIVHGDAKAANVMLSTLSPEMVHVAHREYTAKLGDFTTARHISDKPPVTSKSSTQQARLPSISTSGAAGAAHMVTATHTAPEVLLGDGAKTFANDVYALGVTMWETLTGQRPYCRLTHMDLIQRKMSTPTSVALPFSSSTPAELVQLAHECWLPDPEARPTAAQVQARLRHMAESVAPRVVLDVSTLCH